MFVAAYMTTITVNAQTVVDGQVQGATTTMTTGDAISLGSGDSAVLTGTIVDADENWVLVRSSGKEIKVILDDVNLKDEADNVFKKGQQVSVKGSMKGDDFGTPLMRAKNITASENAAVTIAP